jgi:hypothetical protein
MKSHRRAGLAFSVASFDRRDRGDAAGIRIFTRAVELLTALAYAKRSLPGGEEVLYSAGFAKLEELMPKLEASRIDGSKPSLNAFFTLALGRAFQNASDKHRNNTVFSMGGYFDPETADETDALLWGMGAFTHAADEVGSRPEPSVGTEPLLNALISAALASLTIDERRVVLLRAEVETLWAQSSANPSGDVVQPTWEALSIELGVAARPLHERAVRKINKHIRTVGSLVLATSGR